MNGQIIKRTDFPRTTASQRKLLFHTWEITGDIQLACKKAHVCEGTFYHWKPRFEKSGYQGLEEFASHAPKTPHRTPHEIELRVIELKKRHPTPIQGSNPRSVEYLQKKNHHYKISEFGILRQALAEGFCNR